jgi:hypothetical protein
MAEGVEKVRLLVWERLRVWKELLEIGRCEMRGRLLKVAFVLMLGASVWADGWEITGSMNAGRRFHTADLLNDGKVLVTGGVSNGVLCQSCELYDPRTETWTVTGSMIVERVRHTTNLLLNGGILAVGGNDDYSIFSSCEIYDPVAWVWSMTSDMNTRRIYGTSTLLNDGSVLVAGGADSILASFGLPYAALSSCEIYNGASWSPSALMNTARYGHAAILLPSGKVLAVGGRDKSAPAQEIYLTSCEIFDPATGNWFISAGTVNEASHHTLTLLENGKVLITGDAVCALYDPATDAVAATGSMVYNRYNNYTVTLLPDGKALAAGGLEFGCTSSCEVYDPVTGTWTRIDSLRDKRVDHTATLISNGKVLVAGGYSNPGPSALSSCELWDADGVADSTGGISGIVCESDSVGMPIQGAFIHAFECAGFHEGNAYTDQRGGYVIDGLNPGSYYVEVSAGGFVHEFYDDALELADATPVDVLADQTTPSINFMLGSEDTTESECISGTVVDAAGDPLSCLIVAFKGKADFFVATSNDSGCYSVEDISADTFYVYAWAPGYIAEYYDDAIAWDDATGVFATADDIDFALAPATKDGPGGISGTITSTGKDGPVGDAMVYAMTGGQAVGCARSWADGRYAIDGLNAGTYTIRATRAFYGTADYATLIEVTEGTVPDVDIVIPQTGVETSDKGLKTEGYLAVGSANPTIGGALISYHIPVSMHVAVKVYNASGALVKTLVDGHQNANSYSVRWNGGTNSGKTAPSGIYFCSLQTNDFRSVVKINLVR